MLLYFLLYFRQPFKFALPNANNRTIEQKLDHFDSHSNAKFNQTYYYFTFPKSNKTKTIVLYLGSEDVPALDFSYSASKFSSLNNSLFFSLEHRFFGTSLPKGNLTKDDLLQYLTTSQVLNDIAYFINYIKTKYCTECSVTLFGGGYLGTLASWFNIKYPHFSTNILASSSPIIIKKAIPTYDENVYNMISNYNCSCAKSISQLLQNSKDDANYLYILSESISNSILYPHYTPNLITDICSRFKGSIQSLEEALKYSNEQLSDTFESLNFSSYANTSIYSDFKDYRSWTWLKCTEIGLWHTSSNNNDKRIRPTSINEDFFNKVCLKLFNQNMTVLQPENYGNEEYKGLYSVFINMQNDPMNSTFIAKKDNLSRRFTFNIADDFRFGDMLSKTSNETGHVLNTSFQLLNNWTNEEKYPIDCNHGINVLSGCVCEEHYGTEFCKNKMHPYKSFKTITVLSVIVPTILLLIIGGGIWFCGKREDNEIGARPTLYT